MVGRYGQYGGNAFVDSYSFNHFNLFLLNYSIDNKKPYFANNNHLITFSHRTVRMTLSRRKDRIMKLREKEKVCEISEKEFTEMFAAVATDYIMDNEKIFGDKFDNFIAFLMLSADLQSALRKKMFGEDEDDENEEYELYDEIS